MTGILTDYLVDNLTDNLPLTFTYISPIHTAHPPQMHV